MSPESPHSSQMQEAPRLAIAVAFLATALAVAVACAPAARQSGETPDRQTPAPEPRIVAADPPAADGAMAPQLSPAAGGGAWLSWLEPRGEGADGASTGHRLRVARFDGASWGAPVTVAEGDDFFANWADTPSVVEGAGGELLAHWLAKVGDGTYAYGVYLARSSDGGATWEPLGLLHDDDSASEHGFVSLVPAAGGGFDAVWLDGRAVADPAQHGDGAMSLRAARVVDGEPRDETLLDGRVCDCCQTAAVAVPASEKGEDSPELVVAYRDRSVDEVRDVSLLRGSLRGSAWSEPRPLHEDGWVIAGCPVNGPALAADGRRVAAAWFTGAGGEARVRAAVSEDGGASFGPPLEVDADGPLGRVDVAWAGDGSGAAVVSWLGADGGVWLRRVRRGVDGVPDLGTPYRLAVTSTARASGFPRLLAAAPADGTTANPAGTLRVAWVETGEDDAPRRLRFATVVLPSTVDTAPAPAQEAASASAS